MLIFSEHKEDFLAVCGVSTISVPAKVFFIHVQTHCAVKFVASGDEFAKSVQNCPSFGFSTCL